MKSKGLDEDIFTNMDDYDASCDDYDYYYEFKTPSQYVKDKLSRAYGDKLNDDDIDTLCGLMTSDSFYSNFIPKGTEKKEKRIRTIMAINEYLTSRGINEIFTQPEDLTQCDMEFSRFIHFH